MPTDESTKYIPMKRQRISKTLDRVRSYMLPHNQIYNLDQRDMIAKVGKRGISSQGTQTQISENLRNRYSKKSLNEQEKYLAELKRQIKELEEQKQSLMLPQQKENGVILINELYISQDIPDIINKSTQQYNQTQTELEQSQCTLHNNIDVHKHNITRMVAKRTQQQRQQSQKSQIGQLHSPFQQIIKNINEFVGNANSAENTQIYEQAQYRQQEKKRNIQYNLNLNGSSLQSNYSQQVQTDSNDIFPQMHLIYQSDSKIPSNRKASLFSQSSESSQALSKYSQQKPRILCQANRQIKDSFIDDEPIKQINNTQQQKYNIQQKKASISLAQNQINNTIQRQNPVSLLSISSDCQPIIQTQSQQIHHNIYQKDLIIEFEPQISKFYNMKVENNIYDLQNKVLAKGNIVQQLINVKFSDYVNNIQTNKFCVCTSILHYSNQNLKEKKRKNNNHNINTDLNNQAQSSLIALEHKSFNIRFQSLGQQSLLDDEMINLIGQYICITKNSHVIQMTKRLLMSQYGRKTALEYVKNNKLCFYLDSQSNSSQSLLFKQSQKYQQLLKIVRDQLYQVHEIADVLCHQIEVYAFLCQDRHWIGFCYENNIIYYFDGLNLNNMKFETLDNFLKLIQEYESPNYQRLNIPKQKNSYDCGIYCLLTMLQKTLIDNSFNIYRYAPVFREWIVKSVLLFGS